LLDPGTVVALSDSMKSQALAGSLEDQFQPVNNPLSPVVIEVVNEVTHAYEYVLASELKLTSPSEVLEAIKGLMIGGLQA
jgi:hypothetical protein